MKYIKNSKNLKPIFTGCVEERETTITLGAYSSDMTIYTADNTMLTKLKKVLDANPDTVKCWEAGRDSNGNATGYFFELDKRHLSIRQTVGREMTADQKAAFGERIKQLHAEGKMKR
jgi:hypothetical protein